MKRTSYEKLKTPKQKFEFAADFRAIFADFLIAVVSLFLLRTRQAAMTPRGVHDYVARLLGQHTLIKVLKRKTFCEGLTLNLRMQECVRMSKVRMKNASFLAERCLATWLPW